MCLLLGTGQKELPPVIVSFRAEGQPLLTIHERAIPLNVKFVVLSSASARMSSRRRSCCIWERICARASRLK